MTSGGSHLQRLNNSCPNNNLTPLATNMPTDNGTSNISGLASMQQLTSGNNIADAPPLQHVQKQTGPTVSPPATMLVSNKPSDANLFKKLKP